MGPHQILGDIGPRDHLILYSWWQLLVVKLDTWSFHLYFCYVSSKYHSNAYFCFCTLSHQSIILTKGEHKSHYHAKCYIWEWENQNSFLAFCPVRGYHHLKVHWCYMLIKVLVRTIWSISFKMNFEIGPSYAQFQDFLTKQKRNKEKANKAKTKQNKTKKDKTRPHKF